MKGSKADFKKFARKVRRVLKRKPELISGVLAQPDLFPYVTSETSITQLLRRGKSDVKMASSDLDPNFLPAECPEPAGEQDPKDYDGGHVISSAAGSSDGSNISGIAWACDAMGKDGFATFEIRASNPRDSMPDWVLRQEMLVEFIKSRIGPSDLVAKRIPLRAQIDYVILFDFYWEVFTDEEIFNLGVERTTGVFEPMFKILRRDKSGSRFTNSVKALTARRERLVKAGNKYFKIEAVKCKQDSDNWDDDFNITSARTNFKQGWVNTRVFGSGTVETPCAVNGCQNRIATPKAITGRYICPQHPVKTFWMIAQEKQDQQAEAR